MAAAVKTEAYYRDQTDGVKKQWVSQILSQRRVDTEAKWTIYAPSKGYTHTHTNIFNIHICIYFKLRHSVLLPCRG